MKIDWLIVAVFKVLGFKYLNYISKSPLPQILLLLMIVDVYTLWRQYLLINSLNKYYHGDIWKQIGLLIRLPLYHKVDSAD